VQILSEEKKIYSIFNIEIPTIRSCALGFSTVEQSLKEALYFLKENLRDRAHEMSAIGSLIFCTDCGNLLQESRGDVNTIIVCDVCGARNRGEFLSFSAKI